MLSYYLDTSALLKRYRTERGTETVTELFDAKLPDERLVTSYLSAVEVEAVAARALKGRVLRRRAYQTLLGRFAEDLATSLSLEAMSSHTLTDAASVARQYALRAPDAIHLATARLLRASTGSQPVYVTSDQELAGAAERDGSPLLNPEDGSSLATLRRYRQRG